MKSRSYNREFIVATAMVLDVFNDVIIDRRDATGTVQKLIKVPCVYGNRTRILKSLENYNKTLKIPMFVLSQEGHNRDNTRVHSVNEVLGKTVTGHFDIRQIIANPINMNFTLSMIAKYQEDIDQMVTNWVPFFNPSIYISWPNPSGNGNIKAPLTWDGDINIEYPVDIDETEPYRIIAEATFVLKMWIYPGMWDGENGELDEPLIYNINLCNGTHPISGCVTGSSLQGFYDVPMAMDMDEYCQNAADGLIELPHFDVFPISGGVEGSCFQSVCGEISGRIYNPKCYEDLIFLIENVDNPELELIADAHGYAYPGWLSKPMQMVDGEPIWRSMLIGSLSGCWCPEECVSASLSG
jgi:hypothetical protein